MSAHCHDHCASEPRNDPRYRKVLWLALLINATMFIVELLASQRASSAALLADSIDFLGDAANYGVSLLVLGAAMAWRARASLLKSACMALFGLLVLAKVLWNIRTGTVPDAATMGWVAALALLANVGVAVLLYAWRDGDSNMRSVWLCTRNDAIGNLAVLLAAAGVLGTHTLWPDVLVATLMAALALHSAWQIQRQARGELRHAH
jgi:Co/Zn/Cd efflux system component